MVHSPVGGSGMPRWQQDRCPGSVAMAYHYPNISSTEAIEGTAAHTLAEICGVSRRRPSYYLGCELPGGIVVGDEMVEHIGDYLNHVNALAIWSENAWFELPLSAPFNPMIAGTIDHLAAAGKTAYLTDLKYGFIPIMATTPQLKYYAALVKMNIGTFDTYVLTAYQPRLFNRANADTMLINDYELSTWIDAVLLPSVELALSHNAPRRPGDWCRYCPGKMDCPELKEQIKYLQPPFHTTNEELSYFLSLSGTVKNAIKDMQADGINRLMRGEIIPNFKPVRRTGSGKIKDIPGFVNAMTAAGTPADELYKTELRGITELRKISNKTVNDYIIRTDGKTAIVPLDDPAAAIAPLTQQFGKPQNV